mmetsp:Transcript_33357/g.56006  ORF Transcript_33357/g.56006 Transcript_33357/m.56006 type:complete len:804 (-) Transcript_33357:146-2557(-)
MENLLSEAGKQGMYLVDHDNTDALITEYDDTIAEADALCDVVDPETNPYESKYKARKLLDQIINKLDATRAIAKIEMKHSTLSAMDIRLASAKLRVGTISFEVEEPHNAQTDLELACQFYFPDLVEQIFELAGPEDGAEDPADGTTKAASLDKPLTSDDIKPTPELPALSEVLVVDAMKTLNLLGILWAGRGQVHKSMLFLLSAHKFYLAHTSGGQIVTYAAKTIKDMGYAYTHNLFYLAQAYGNIGDVAKSCTYCHQTLQRQFNEGFKDIRSALDWVKNCCGISDFYLAMRQYNKCALALSCAEYVLKSTVIPLILSCTEAASSSSSSVTKATTALPTAVTAATGTSADADGTTAVPPPPPPPSTTTAAASTTAAGMGLGSVAVADAASCRLEADGTSNYISGPLNAAEIGAELHRRWAMLDVCVLRRAFDRAKLMENAIQMGVGLAELEASLQEPCEDDNGEDDFNPLLLLDQQQQGAAEAEAVAVAVVVYPEVEFFQGIRVRPTPGLTSGRDISSFESARKVFLRATGRIEAAKRYYLLDGYVTDHVTLTQEHSKLYHYLSAYEADSKRKLAMQSRRYELLAPILKALNISSYEVLHKQISYELGECALAMLDIKLDKFRERSPTGEIAASSLKKAEINKSNEYCKSGIVMFAHFTYLYANIKNRDATTVVQSLEDLPLYEAVSMGCTQPDESLISAEEVRPFLNAHFLCCRIMSKVIATPAFLPAPVSSTAASNPAHFLVSCLRRYEWLSTFTTHICKLRGVSIEETFAEEHKIIQEMVKLLPSKIDRMTFLGESGLSL